MTDLYRKERRRKRLKEREQHTPYPYQGKPQKPRREAYKRSQEHKTQEDT